MNGADDADPEPPQPPSLQVQQPGDPQPVQDFQPVAIDRLTQALLQVQPQEKQERKWEIERKEEWKNMEAYRVRATADKGQIFQILGFYAVFQGVVVNTACTSTKLNCRTSSFLVLLSALLSVGTLFSVWYKFTDYMENNKKVLNSEKLFEIVKARIMNPAFYKQNSDSISSRVEKKIQKDEHTRRKFKWAVMSFLFLFSIVILLCCVIIRCVE